ncbi:MAG TPA: 6,7-dimethyl-8-ribityllumazine synthase [Dehalococcoidia bacterium]|nr:6,7-dimethyl-8-ribityllumazine synthase [Dehalococcoidia bacterium]
MPRELNGHSDGSGLRIGIVVARFNSYITDRMLQSALARLGELGVSDADVTVAYVPGAFEIPVTAAAMARSDNYDSVICIGAVIEGETAHFEYVSKESADGIARLSVDTGVPVIFGVQTTYTTDQAYARIDHASGYAEASVEMVNLLRTLNDA